MLVIDLLLSFKDLQSHLWVRHVQINYIEGWKAQKLSRYAKGKSFPLESRLEMLFSFIYICPF